MFLDVFFDTFCGPGFGRFFRRFGCLSGAPGRVPGPIWGPFWAPPGGISGTSAGPRRGGAGKHRLPPYFLSGLPLGYGDLRSSLNSPYPPGIGVLDPPRNVRTPSVPGGFPSLPPRQPSADHRTLQRDQGWHPFFRLFFNFGLRVRFGVSAQTAAATASSGIGPGAVQGRSGIDFRRFWLQKWLHFDSFFGVFPQACECQETTIKTVLS